jgi:hypothetical protein
MLEHHRAYNETGMRQFGIAVGLAAAGFAAAQNGPVTTFGVTVVDMSGLCGNVYLINEGYALPNFEKLKPVGALYTTALNIPQRDFEEGFPGITDRFEWFAIDYTGRFWIEKPGPYRFSLTSDDGSRLYIDGEVVINNDGLHAPLTAEGLVTLSEGLHRIRLSYFQGPRFHIALVLAVARPGEPLRIFNTKEFKPPPDLETSKYADPSEAQDGAKKPRKRKKSPGCESSR